MSQSIDVHQLYSLFETEQPFYILDVREYPEYAAGRISGAHLIPYRKLASRHSEINRDVPVYVICQAGVRSRRAQRRLERLGLNPVRNVEGGMRAWMAAGYGVRQDARRPWPLERQERVVVGTLILISLLLSVLVSPAFVWAAAVFAVALSLAAIADSCALEMLIARMPWNQPPTETAGAT